MIGIQRSMWLAAKDHSKINEGEVKEKYGRLVQSVKTVALQATATGSSPVPTTIPQPVGNKLGNAEGARVR